MSSHQLPYSTVSWCWSVRLNSFISAYSVYKECVCVCVFTEEISRLCSLQGRICRICLCKHCLYINTVLLCDAFECLCVCKPPHLCYHRITYYHPQVKTGFRWDPPPHPDPFSTCIILHWWQTLLQPACLFDTLTKRDTHSVGCSDGESQTSVVSLYLRV